MSAELDVAVAGAHHLLAVPDGVALADVEALASCWFPQPAPVAANALLLTGDAVLAGPWTLDPDELAELGLPAHDRHAFLLRVPAQRGEPFPELLPDVTGLARAFPDGMPEGVEGEALNFLLAAARRLGAALRASGSGVVLTPDPEADVDLWVHSPVWLHPDALLGVLQPVLPSARLAMDVTEDMAGPARPADGGEPAAPGSGAEQDERGAPSPEDVLGAVERDWLHAESRAFDEAALAGPVVLDAYGATAPVPEGSIEVGVSGDEVVPFVLRSLDWAQAGVVTYLVRWWPPDPESLADPSPGAQLRARRARARALVARVAVAVHEAVGGEIVDEHGFLVDPVALRAE